MLLSMAVMERDAWTDERLDDLATGIDKRFDRVDRDLAAVNKKVEALDDKFDRKFDSLQRNMTLWFISLSSTIIASLITAVFAVISLT
jgi:hypothetical protein